MPVCRNFTKGMPLPGATLLLELDLAAGSIKMQDYLKTPVTPVAWDVVSVMHNSMFSGYSRGLIKAKTPAGTFTGSAARLKALYCAPPLHRCHRDRKMGDEPSREPAEMRPMWKRSPPA